MVRADVRVRDLQQSVHISGKLLPCFDTFQQLIIVAFLFAVLPVVHPFPAASRPPAVHLASMDRRVRRCMVRYPSPLARRSVQIGIPRGECVLWAVAERAGIRRGAQLGGGRDHAGIPRIVDFLRNRFIARESFVEWYIALSACKYFWYIIHRFRVHAKQNVSPITCVAEPRPRSLGSIPLRRLALQLPYLRPPVHRSINEPPAAPRHHHTRPSPCRTAAPTQKSTRQNRCQKLR